MSLHARYALFFTGLALMPVLASAVVIHVLAEDVSPLVIWPSAAAALVVTALISYGFAGLVVRPLRGVAEAADVRKTLSLLGETLRSTHDLARMFEVVLDSAAVALGASAGAIYLLSPSGRELRLRVPLGFDPPEGAWVPIGEGVAGRAATGAPVLLPSSAVKATLPPEPATSTATAAPFVRNDRTIGVLALYGRAVRPFTEDDLATLATFAGQASVAIDNILLHQEAERLSITDGLTGLWNRRYLQLMLRQEIDRAHRFSRPFCVLMLDIDRFKAVNDEHGHLRGDEVLVEVSRRVKQTIRGSIDSVARFGGEEFVVVLPETPTEGGRVVAEKVRAVIGKTPFQGEPDLPLTVSIGVATYPTDGTTVRELVEAADRAMYRAKEGGRDRVEVSADGYGGLPPAQTGE